MRLIHDDDFAAGRTVGFEEHGHGDAEEDAGGVVVHEGAGEVDDGEFAGTEFWGHGFAGEVEEGFQEVEALVQVLPLIGVELGVAQAAAEVLVLEAAGAGGAHLA